MATLAPGQRLNPPRWAAWVAIAIALGTALLTGFGLLRLRTNNDDLMRWLPDRSPGRGDYEYFRKFFSNDEYLIVHWAGCRVDDPRLTLVTADLRTESPEPWIESVTSGADVLAALVDRSSSHPSDSTIQQRLAGVFFGGPDLKDTCIVVTLTPYGRDHRPAAIAWVEAVLRRTFGATSDSREQVALAGYPWIAVALGRSITETFFDWLPWSAAGSTAVAWVCLRRFRWVLIVLAVAGLGAGAGVGWGVCLTGGLGGLTMIVPTLGFVLTMSGGLHLIRYSEHAPGDWRALINTGWQPCSVSMLTTVIGIGTLLTSNFWAVREFAWVSGATLLHSWLLQIALYPWLISRWGGLGDASIISRPESRGASLERFLKRSRFAAGVGLFVASVMALAAVWQLPKLTSNVEADQLFRRDSSVLRGIARIESQIGPLDVTEALLVFPTGSSEVPQRNGAFVRQFSELVGAIPQVSRTVSLQDFWPAPKRTSGVLGHFNQRVYRELLRSPTVRSVVDDWYYRDETQEIWRVSLKIPFLQAVDFEGVQTAVSSAHEKLTAASRRQWPGFDPPRLIYTGVTHLTHQAQGNLLRDFAGSFGLAFVIIAPILLFSLRSWPLAVIGLLANLWPIAVVYGILAAWPQPIDIALGMCASIALGIAVDDSTHFLLRFREKYRSGTSGVEPAVAATLEECGPAMIATTCIACVGIGVFAASELLVISRFAWVISGTLLAALIADVLFVPCALILWKSRLSRRQLAAAAEGEPAASSSSSHR